jgi:hypothetical protein
MTPRKMQIDRRFFKVGTSFEQMSGKAVAAIYHAK